ncbi:MAG: carboxypeptidase-like regulatory domain-containing protein, partial [Rhodanobacter sp.]
MNATRNRCTARGSAVKALVMAIGLGLGCNVLAQSTTGRIFGEIAPGQGDAVLIKSSTGITREIPVDAKGRYATTELPIGNYMVSLQRNGQIVDTRNDVIIRVGSSTEVSFVPQNAKTLTGIT